MTVRVGIGNSWHAEVERPTRSERRNARSRAPIACGEQKRAQSAQLHPFRKLRRRSAGDADGSPGCVAIKLLHEVRQKGRRSTQFRRGLVLMSPNEVFCCWPRPSMERICRKTSSPFSRSTTSFCSRSVKIASERCALGSRDVSRLLFASLEQNANSLSFPFFSRHVRSFAKPLKARSRISRLLYL